MAGPWDNVQLAGPPNGPAYINSAMNAASTLGNLVNSGFNAYRQGQDFQYQQAQRDFFKDPANQDLFKKVLQTGSLEDYANLQQKLVPVIGAQGAEGIIQQFMGLKSDQDFSNALRPGGAQAPNPTAPQAGNPAQILGRQSDPRVPVNQANNFQGSGNEGPDTVRSLVAGLANGRPVSNATINNYAKSLGVTPDADLDEEQAKQAQRIISNSLAKQGISTPTPNRGGINPTQPSGTDEQGIGKSTASLARSNELKPSSVQGGPPISPAPTSGGGKIRSAAPPPSAVAGDGLEEGRNARQAQTSFNERFGASGDRSGELRRSPLGTTADAQRLREEGNEILARGAIAARRSPAAKDLAEKSAKAKFDQADRIDESVAKYNEPATNPDVKAQLEQYGETAKAAGKRVGETIEAGGKAARDTINTLDVMETSLRRSAGNFSTGPGAQEVLKFKEAVNNLFPGTFSPTQVLDAEAITKLNAALASTAAKQLTSRPSQLEFRAFMQNNPGLATSPAGSLFLIDILRQEQRQSIKLGQLALDKKNWDNWGSVEQAFYDSPKNKINIPKKPEQFGPIQTSTPTTPQRFRWTPQGLQPIRQ